MIFRQATLAINGKMLTLQPGRSNSFDEIFVDFQLTELDGGQRWSVFLHPKEDIIIQGLELQFQLNLPEGSRVFCNGYQSWSESRLLDLDESVPRLRSFARSRLGFYGDEHIEGIPRGRGRFHSWTYTYFRKPASTILAGSLDERTGFTLFLYDRNSGVLTVRKDIAGLQLGHSFPALDFWLGESTENDVFNVWAGALQVPHARLSAPAALGWTSWYRHFTAITPEILVKNLEAVAESPTGFEYFQIDDGWQTAVGDWFSVKPEFKEGMGMLAGKIRAKGMKPGLWLAPFVASASSEFIRRNPDWLLKDGSGKPIKVGWNPAWGGWYYALDFYHGGVRDYLSGVFHLVLDKWGFELLKLDFLFAVCLAPPKGKTRGGVMWEAMEFLRNQLGERKMLACGVPLGSCMGLTDYCRIGGDIHMRWEHKLLFWLRFRERVSTLASLRNTLNRWQLNKRVFLNDPDVFILRSGDQHLTPEQQHTVLIINVLLGNLLFTSDDLSEYSPEQLAELECAMDWRGSRIRRVSEISKDVYCIEFDKTDERFEAYCNLRGKAATLENIQLLPYETIVFNIANH